VPNPIFNEKTIDEAKSKWPAPQSPSPGGQAWPAPSPVPTEYHPPIDDGPSSPWRGAMTVRGSLSATAVLFTLLLVSATAGWFATPSTLPGEPVEFPALAIGGVIVGFVCVIALYFKPQYAKFLGPVYALAQGFFVGAISRAYENQWNGIVLQAAGATIAVFGVMLALYRTRIIKVTDRFRRTVIFATLGIMVFYLVSIVISLFGGEVPFLNDASVIGIGFSFLVAGVAALNLALDFDFIERGAKAPLPKDYEWVAAVGLLVTLVWLYLEILRLLAKLRE
jgi:uncharacterized YccA/Bax inhibitor family protein